MDHGCGCPPPPFIFSFGGSWMSEQWRELVRSLKGMTVTNSDAVIIFSLTYLLGILIVVTKPVMK
jgi:hypothetical protein